MEAGVATNTKRLVKRIQNRTDRTFELISEDQKLVNAPTLVELEGCFRRIKPRKAAGADGIKSDICSLAPTQLARKFHPVLMKLFLRGEEPAQMKGGLIVSAHKSGATTQLFPCGKSSEKNPEAKTGSLLQCRR